LFPAAWFATQAIVQPAEVMPHQSQLTPDQGRIQFDLIRKFAAALTHENSAGEGPDAKEFQTRRMSEQIENLMSRLERDDSMLAYAYHGTTLFTLWGARAAHAKGAGGYRLLPSETAVQLMIPIMSGERGVGGASNKNQYISVAYSYRTSRAYAQHYGSGAASQMFHVEYNFADPRMLEPDYVKGKIEEITRRLAENYALVHRYELEPRYQADPDEVNALYRAYIQPLSELQSQFREWLAYLEGLTPVDRIHFHEAAKLASIPIVVGMSSRITERFWRSPSGRESITETLVREYVDVSEISVVYTPESDVPLVEQFLHESGWEHIKVVPWEIMDLLAFADDPTIRQWAIQHIERIGYPIDVKEQLAAEVQTKAGQLIQESLQFYPYTILKTLEMIDDNVQTQVKFLRVVSPRLSQVGLSTLWGPLVPILQGQHRWNHHRLLSDRWIVKALGILEEAPYNVLVGLGGSWGVFLRTAVFLIDHFISWRRLLVPWKTSVPWRKEVRTLGKDAKLSSRPADLWDVAALAALSLAAGGIFAILTGGLGIPFVHHLLIQGLHWNPWLARAIAGLLHGGLYNGWLAPRLRRALGAPNGEARAVILEPPFPPLVPRALERLEVIFRARLTQRSELEEALGVARDLRENFGAASPAAFNQAIRKGGTILQRLYPGTARAHKPPDLVMAAFILRVLLRLHPLREALQPAMAERWGLPEDLLEEISSGQPGYRTYRHRALWNIVAVPTLAADEKDEVARFAAQNDRALAEALHEADHLAQQFLQNTSVMPSDEWSAQNQVVGLQMLWTLLRHHGVRPEITQTAEPETAAMDTAELPALPVSLNNLEPGDRTVIEIFQTILRELEDHLPPPGELRDAATRQEADRFRLRLQACLESLTAGIVHPEGILEILQYWVVHPELTRERMPREFLGFDISRPGLEDLFASANNMIILNASYIKDGRYARLAEREPTLSKEEAFSQMAELCDFMFPKDSEGMPLPEKQWFSGSDNYSERLEEFRRLTRLPLVDHIWDPYGHDSPSSIRAALLVRLLVYLQAAIQTGTLKPESLQTQRVKNAPEIGELPPVGKTKPSATGPMRHEAQRPALPPGEPHPTVVTAPSSRPDAAMDTHVPRKDVTRRRPSSSEGYWLPDQAQVAQALFQILLASLTPNARGPWMESRLRALRSAIQYAITANRRGRLAREELDGILWTVALYPELLNLATLEAVLRQAAEAVSQGGSGAPDLRNLLTGVGPAAASANPKDNLEALNEWLHRPEIDAARSHGALRSATGVAPAASVRAAILLRWAVSLGQILSTQKEEADKIRQAYPLAHELVSVEEFVRYASLRKVEYVYDPFLSGPAVSQREFSAEVQRVPKGSPSLHGGSVFITAAEKLMPSGKAHYGVFHVYLAEDLAPDQVLTEAAKQLETMAKEIRGDIRKPPYNPQLLPWLGSTYDQFTPSILGSAIESYLHVIQSSSGHTAMLQRACRYLDGEIQGSFMAYGKDGHTSREARIIPVPDGDPRLSGNELLVLNYDHPMSTEVRYEEFEEYHIDTYEIFVNEGLLAPEFLALLMEDPTVPPEVRRKFNTMSTEDTWLVLPLWRPLFALGIGFWIGAIRGIWDWRSAYDEAGQWVRNRWVAGLVIPLLELIFLPGLPMAIHALWLALGILGASALGGLPFAIGHFWNHRKDLTLRQRWARMFMHWAVATAVGILALAIVPAVMAGITPHSIWLTPAQFGVAYLIHALFNLFVPPAWRMSLDEDRADSADAEEPLEPAAPQDRETRRVRVGDSAPGSEIPPTPLSDLDTKILQQDREHGIPIPPSAGIILHVGGRTKRTITSPVLNAALAALGWTSKLVAVPYQIAEAAPFQKLVARMQAGRTIEGHSIAGLLVGTPLKSILGASLVLPGASGPYVSVDEGIAWVESIEARYGRGFFEGKTVTVIGAGAVGSAIADAMAEKGVKKIVLVVKSDGAAKAETLTGTLRKRGVEVEVVLGSEALGLALSDSDVVVNATGQGRSPHEDASPLPDVFNVKLGAVYAELDFKPLWTRFLLQAKANGAALLVNGAAFNHYFLAVRLERVLKHLLTPAESMDAFERILGFVAEAARARGAVELDRLSAQAA
jgi:hypothetical protein